MGLADDIISGKYKSKRTSSIANDIITGKYSRDLKEREISRDIIGESKVEPLPSSVFKKELPAMFGYEPKPERKPITQPTEFTRAPIDFSKARATDVFKAPKKPTGFERFAKGAERFSEKVLDVTEPARALSIQMDPSLGLMTKAHETLDPSAKQERLRLQEKYPKLSTTGEIAGYILPGVGASKAAGKGVQAASKYLPKLAKGTGLSLGGLTVAEGLAGAGMGAIEEYARGEEGQFGGDIGKGTLYGGLFGAGTTGLLGGASKYGKQFFDKTKFAQNRAIDRQLGRYIDEGIFGASKASVPTTTAPIRRGIKETSTSPRQILEQPITPFGKTARSATTDISRQIDIPQIKKPKQLLSEPITPFKDEPRLKPQIEQPSYTKYKNASELPDDAKSLTKIVEEMREAQRKGAPINLQLFGQAQEKLKKISKFRTNTIERAVDISDEAKKQLDVESFDYIPEKSKDWQDKAVQNINNNREEVIAKIQDSESISGGVQAHEAAILTQQLLDEASKTGNWETAKAFVKTVASKTRETARALKGTDTGWQKSPAGAIQKATREVDNFTDDVLKQNPNTGKKVKDQIKKAKDVIKKARKERDKTVEDVINKFIDSKPKVKGKKQVSEKVKRSDLVKWVKDFYATGRFKRQEFVEQAVRKSGLSGDDANRLYNKLQSELKSKTKQVKDQLLENIMKPKKAKKVQRATEKLTELTNIGLLENKKFVNRVGEKINPVVKKLMKDNGISLDEIVRMAGTNRRKQVGKMLKDVFKNTRVDDVEINKLLNVIRSEFDNLAADKRKAILNRMAGIDAQGKLIEKAIPKGDLDKLIEKINLGLYDDTTDAMVRQMILEKNNIPQLRNDDIQFIFDTMKGIEGKSLDDEVYREGIAKIKKLIAEKKSSTFGDKVRSIGFQSMLGTPSSNVTNIIGNLFNVAPEIALNPLKRGLDVAMGGKRVTGKIDTIKLLKGGKEGLRSVKRDMLGGKDFKDFKNFKELYDSLANPIDASRTNIGRDKFIEGSRLAFDNNPLRITENLVSSALSAGDRPFEQAFYDVTLDAIMKSEGVDVATKEMREFATEIAKGVTFKGDNFISGLLSGLKDVPKNYLRNKGVDINAFRGLKKVGWSIPEIAANTLLPFVKTPANIVKRTLEYSPVGLMEGTLKLLANRKNMSMLKKREIIDVLSRGILGSGMMGLGYGLGRSGYITGDRPSNYNASSLKRQQGAQANALNIAGMNIDLKKFYPFTAPIVSGAILANGDKTGTLDSYFESSAGAINNLTEISLLSTLSKASELFNPTSHKDKSKILLDLAMQLPSQLTPALVKKITHWSDDYERNLTGDTLVEHAWNNYVGRLPGVSKMYPEKVDWKGDPVERYGGMNSFLNVMFNPYKVTEVKDEPILNESLRLYDISGESSTLLPSAKYTNTLGKNKRKGFDGYNLSVRDKNKYQKFLGDKLQDELTDFIQSSRYKSYSDEKKQEKFEDKISDARKSAKRAMIKHLQQKNK